MIVEVDGMAIADNDDLWNALNQQGVGETIPIRVRRGDRIVELSVTLQSLE